MQLISAHIDQPTRMWEPPALQRCRDALVRGSNQDQKQDCEPRGDEHAADKGSHGGGSGLRFGESVLLDPRVELGTREAEQLRGARLVVTRLRERLDDE